MVNTENAMGGSATPLSYSELYSALEQGVPDGAENAAGNLLNDRFYEVTGHLSMTWHLRPPAVVAISLGAWNGLTEEQQADPVEEGKRTQDYEIKPTAVVGVAAIEKLKARGWR